MKEFIKKHKMSLFIMMSSLVMLIGLSYAWLQLTLRGDKELTLRAGTLRLVLDDSMSEGIMMENAVPVTDKEGLATTGYTFTLENTGNISSSYEIYLDDLDILEEETRMQDSYLRYELKKDGEVVGYDLLNTVGISPNRILDAGEINPNTKHTYILKLWIDSNVGNEVMGTVFKGQLRVEAMQEKNDGLYKRIAKLAKPDDEASEFVTAQTGIDFLKSSSDTNGKGVYTLTSTKNDKFPVHYYRGAVTNNNLKFAGFCWKIVRTTSTGGIKIIYNGNPDNNGGCSNTTGEATQIGTTAFNRRDNSPAYAGYVYGNVDYIYQSKSISGLTEEWVYGNDIEWDGTNYILKDTITSNTSQWNKDYLKIAKKYHYSCFSTESSCSEVGYINYFNNDNRIYHLNLKLGKNIEDAKREMFSNITDSAIKEKIDIWYEENMLDYTENLEDTIWCNDRSIDRGPLKSKDSDSSTTAGSTTNNYTFLGAEERVRHGEPNMICPNDNDKFTVSDKNGNGVLTYPIALLTTDELMLAGSINKSISNPNYLYTNQHYWSMSPAYFYYSSTGVYYDYQYDGKLAYNSTSSTIGVRPSVSLAPKTKISGGNGTSEKPFIVENIK